MQLYISDIRPYMNMGDIKFATDARKAAIHKFIQTEDKARCLVAGLLLRKFCGVADDSQLIYGENGKPYLKNGEVYFNISHSGDYVILATAQSEVGVDIEKVTAYTGAVAERCFTPPELEWMWQQETDEAFYRLWTAKESIMKATGLGFNLPPETFCVLPMDSSAHEINGRTWFMDWHLYDGHMICSAVERAEKVSLEIME